MKNKLTPRYIIIALVLVWAVYAIWPTVQYQNLSADEIETMREEGTLKNLESKIIKQGLDLKGGIYIVLEVDLQTLVSNLAINKDKRFEQALNNVDAKIDEDSQLDFFQVFQDEINSTDLRIHRYFDVDFGRSLDEIIVSLRDQADDAINRVLEILQNRVDQFGVSEPTIQKQGNRRIIVELAGIQDSERARDLLQSTALLEFILIKSPELTNDMLLRIDKVIKGSDELADLTQETDTKNIEDTPVPVSEDKTISVRDLFTDQANQTLVDTTDEAVVVDLNLVEDRPFSSLLRALGNDIGVPEKNIYIVKKILAMEDVQFKLDAANGQFLLSDAPESFSNIDGGTEKMYRMFYLEGETELTGGVVEKASATIGGTGSSASGQSIVLLDMNSEGARTWSRVTGGNIGRRVGIVLDKKVHMAPVIRSKISDGGTMIEGFANMDEAKDIAIVLRAGALPVPVDIIEERIVGPSLGADSIAKGTQSVLIGLALVLIFMIVYYRMFGLIADFALIWNIILVLAVLATLDATLTLPGIAAIILTVGMSIDSNVIIFERIREEQRKGKTPRAAIDAGYDRALTTIIDANVTTLVAALVLYQFGTGPIRGFATVLFWGIVISMFTAIFVTRTILNTLTERRDLKTLSI
ncbi:MAG TPA: protein translocase subunit SecD [Candidatus Marinimicrobia bacterium]|nr:protein translocase subunit SecD [Candidatus Neomarinimicrobiota bacterium]